MSMGGLKWPERRTPVCRYMRKPLIIGVIAVIVLVVAVFTSSQFGEAADHRSFPTHADQVKEVGSGVVRLGFGKIRPFVWSAYVERGRPGGPPCFAVSVVGPIHEFTGEGAGGPELGETRCKSSRSQPSQVLAVPIKGGDTWQPFDIGVAAYNTRVTKVSLVVSGEGRKELKTRRLRRNFDIDGVASLRYVVFAVEGCVSKVFGLEKGRVVARDSRLGCGSG